MKEFSWLKVFIIVTLLVATIPYIFTKDRRSELCKRLDRLNKRINSIIQSIHSKF